jgi:hypothetical protein
MNVWPYKVRSSVAKTLLKSSLSARQSLIAWQVGLCNSPQWMIIAPDTQVGPTDSVSSNGRYCKPIWQSLWSPLSVRSPQHKAASSVRTSLRPAVYISILLRVNWPRWAAAAAVILLHREVNSSGPGDLSVKKGTSAHDTYWSFQTKIFVFLVMTAQSNSLPANSQNGPFKSWMKCIECDRVAWVREQTIPAERPQFVGEVSDNFSWYRVARGQRDGSLRPYSRLRIPDPLLFH